MKTTELKLYIRRKAKNIKFTECIGPSFEDNEHSLQEDIAWLDQTFPVNPLTNYLIKYTNQDYIEQIWEHQKTNLDESGNNINAFYKLIYIAQ